MDEQLNISPKKAIVATHHLLDGPFEGGIHYFYQYFKSRKYQTTFITQPLSPRLFITDLGSFYKKLWRVKSSIDHIVHFTPVYPQSVFGPFRKYLFDKYLKIPFFDIDKKLTGFGLTRPDILLCEASLALSVRFSTSPKKYIIRFSDSMIDLGHKKDIVDFFIQQALSADLVLVAAEGIKNELIGFGVNPSIIVALPNGVDLSRYERNYEKPDAYQYFSGPIAVYVGNTEIIDHELLKYSAIQLPHVTFFIIGPYKKQVLRNLPRNLVYHGYVEPNLVPAYLQNATVGLVPIIASRWGIMERPRKLYQYLAAGIPVVSTKGKYSLPTSYVSYADTEHTFISLVKSAVNIQLHKEAIKRYAQNNFSWEQVYRKLDDILSNI